jgi:UDP-N-acetylglucosamine diphosphorylase / glucose-1-phosphate thymidylyltransferase / UDP-N-acetylgalactosamine diphosphorylase / glucosamine-1-phosphate N-acetyltransferase / galactosamine-1-phosphate N-acetyltransferase
MMLPADFFELSESGHRELFQSELPVWTALDRLPECIATYFQGNWPLAGRAGMVTQPLVIVGDTLRDDLTLRTSGPKGIVQAFDGDRCLADAAIIMPGVYLFDDRIIIGPRTVVEPGALIKGPTVLGAGVEVRQGAYLRGNCLVGDGCVVGHATEVKSSIMLEGAKAGHFAYIGDSILGRDVNLGAGTKLANLKMVRGSVSFAFGREHYDTGRRKLGAILGDGAETGCNSVTSPGTLMGPGSVVYPGVAVPTGYYPARSHLRLSRGTLNIKLGKGGHE